MAGEWKPDPTGRHQLRWWSGTAYSSQVSDDGEPSVDRYSPVDRLREWLGRSASNRLTALLAGAIALVGIAVAVVSLATSDRAAGDYGAYLACVDAVEERLRAPTAAEFVDFADTIVLPDGPDAWVWTSTVDAPNGFGVPVRSGFTCHVERDGDEYSVISLDLS